jgi:Cyclophilin type peptidyl-prolyl cis-trans isomerase/CLD
MPLAATILVAWLMALPWQAPRRPAPAAPGPFRTTLSVAQMTGKQAVLDTSLGTVVVDLRPDLAPNHVRYMMKLAGEGAYDGTIKVRIIKQ